MRISSSEIEGYEKEVYTHFEVGLSILSKEADVGIATIAVSKFLGLSFIPITQESFDMILDQSTFFEKGVQAFIEILNSDGVSEQDCGTGELRFQEFREDPLFKKLDWEEDE